MSIINTILGLGATVMMPIIILLLGLVVRMPFIKSLRAGLTVGVGFMGVGLITGMLGSSLGTLIDALQTRWNLSLNTVDVGWPVSSGIAFSTGTFVVAMFAILILLNIVMLMLKLTQTLNVDLWNFWHFIMGGSLAYAMTGSFVLGCVVGGLYGGIVLLLADKHAPALEKFLGYPGVTITTSSFPLVVYFCMAIDWVIDRIPGINKINFNLSKVNPKVSFLAEPIFLGLILGIVLTMIAGYSWKDCLTTGMTMAGVMFILPRMVKILMEGLSTIADGVQTFLSNRFPGRKINIGMDFAIMLGNSEVITLALIMTPVSLLLAVILPGNTLLPFTDLPALTYFMTSAVLAAKGNSFRSLIFGICTASSMLYIATNFAPYFTQVAHNSGLVDSTVSSISAMSAGYEYIAWILVKIVALF